MPNDQGNPYILALCDIHARYNILLNTTKPYVAAHYHQHILPTLPKSMLLTSPLALLSVNFEA